MASKWIDIFALSQFSPNHIKLPYSGRTVRIVVRNYLKGDKIRVTLASRYGDDEIALHKATVAMSDENGVLTGAPEVLKFNGEEHAIIGKKSSVTSDDTVMNIKSGYLSVSIYFKGKAKINSVNMLREKVLISEKGDFTITPEMKLSERITEKLLEKAFKIAGVSKYDIIPLLESISINSDSEKGAVLAFGDSITQGGKWSYELASRMQCPVINLGISGNRLLKDCGFPLVKGLFGEAATKRFDRDVLTRNGAKAIIILLGTNDIGQPGSVSASKSEAVTSDEIIEGLKNIAERAKAAGLYAFVCTLTPFRFFRMGYIGDAKEKRHRVNEWIRNNEYFDGCFDFEKMVSDSGDEEKLKAEYDSGDHLHPSDEGSVKMVDSIDIKLLDRIVKYEDSDNK